MATFVEVDQYAAGDGVTDDTLAIRSALATGKHLRFTRGKTYLYSGAIEPQNGQTLYGNGATLRRRAQVHTTTSSTIVANQTRTIAVADASGLAVGMDIALKTATGYDPNNKTIKAIDGNQVTVALPFGIDASGADVYSSHHGLALHDDCRVYDLVLDGNRANYGYRNWENTHEIHVGGHRAVVSGCHLKECPGEGIYLERNYITITDCVIFNANGNGVHLGSSDRSIIDRVRVVNANLDPSVGHADGCVSLSAFIDHLTVRNCHFENGISGVASWDQTDNSNLTIVGNTIVACRTSALEGWCPQDNAPANVLIANNRIYDSGYVYVASKSAWNETVVFPNHISFRGNVVRNTKVEIIGARWMDVSGNTFDMAGDRTSTVIDLTHGRHVLVRGNVVNGGRYAISVAGESQNVLVEANALEGQALGAIRADPGIVNCQAAGNHVSADDSVDPAYRGIEAGAQELVRDNSVVMTRGNAGIFANSRAIVKDNVVRAGTATSIRTPAGSSGVLIKDNEVTTPVVNDGGTANVEAGTVVVPA